jgi:hypothetical protein
MNAVTGVSLQTPFDLTSGVKSLRCAALRKIVIHAVVVNTAQSLLNELDMVMTLSQISTLS